MTSNVVFKNAKWVTPDSKCDTPLIRGEFDAKCNEKALITICGLGFFELYINAQKVSGDLFVPVASDYHHYDEQFCYKEHGEVLAHRIYAIEYDISSYLTDGKNSIAVMLAPGWYKAYGEVKLCYNIDFENRTVISDETLKWNKSPIVGYDFIHGEKHDYNTTINDNNWMNSGYDDSEWEKVKIIDAPDSEYYIQNCPADSIIRCITPKLILETDDILLYDAGENITGWPVVYCDSGEKEKVVVRVDETLGDDGQMEYRYMEQGCEYLTDATPRELSPRFMWQAFRYIEVTKNARLISCKVIHTNVSVTSHFECDNETLNWLYNTFIHTQLCNMHAGLPSDCPHLEKRGYTGDGQLCAETVMALIDTKKFYRKWIDDISDCQDRISGHVQYTAPYDRCGGGPGGWGCAIVEVPYQYYKMYGDKSPFENLLGQILHYLDYLENHSEDDLVTSDQPGSWCLGDWCAPGKKHKDEDGKIPEPYVNTYFYIKSAMRIIDMADVINKIELKEQMNELIERKKQAIIKEYYDESTGNFCENLQGANAFALDIGMGDERTFNNVINHYESTGVYDTGIFATDIVTRILFERGCADLAVKLLSSQGKPSFHYWMINGATTLWEEWFEPRSMNHPMFGAVVRYMFYYILGIRQSSHAGYEQVIIEPALTSNLNFAKGHMQCEKGKIEVSISRKSALHSIEITIDEHINATLRFGDKTFELHRGLNSFNL